MSVFFQHTDAGTAEDRWATESRLRNAPTLVVPSVLTRLVVLAAHPDDETLGAGGLIAMAAARGMDVHIVIATDGEGSHPRSTTHAPAQLAALRRAEGRAAMLGLSPGANIEFLGLRDGGLLGCIGELAATVRRHVSDDAVIVTPWRGDRHPDHAACALAARAVLRAGTSAAEHWQFPIWGWHWAQPDDLPWEVFRRFEVGDDAVDTKSRALATYRSQQLPLSDQPGDEPILSEAMLAHFRRPYEAFVVEPVHAAADPRYFDELYAESDDPWGLADRFYERRKRELLMATLPRPRFSRAFEPGCASGLLTRRLAQCCDEVVAWDATPRAVELSRQRVGLLPGVQLGQGAIPDEWPAGDFDLIVISEVGYYCDSLHALVDRVRESLTDQGVVVACHWRHDAADHPHTAGAVHAALGVGLHSVAHHVEDDFLLDVWSVSEPSVARAAGIVA